MPSYCRELPIKFFQVIVNYSILSPIALDDSGKERRKAEGGGRGQEKCGRIIFWQFIINMKFSLA
jgi:hypothetical protein